MMLREQVPCRRFGEADPIRPFGSVFASRRRADGPRSRLLDPASAPLASLAGGALAGRFHGWRGCSGRRYVFTVHEGSPEDCPDIEGAVVVLALRLPDGARRMLLACDGADGAALAEARGLARDCGPGARLELHVHLLAETPDERRAVLADLGACALAG